MQRSLSSFDIYTIASELQNIIGSFIDNIYQPTRNELLIKFNNKKTNQKESIYARNEELLCTTQKQIEVPQKPSTFAMTLRKYIKNGKITDIQQHEFDRILKIKIGKKDGEYTIIFELFKNGNIILIDPNEKILIPLKKQQWAHRLIKIKEKYIPPPAQTNPFHLKKQEFIQLIQNSEKDIVRTLAMDLNLSGIYAEELCLMADINKNIKAKELNQNEINKLYKKLEQLLDIFNKKKFQPKIVKKENKTIDIVPITIQNYTELEQIPSKNFNRTLELFIDIKLEKTPKTSKYQKKIEKLQRQLQQQQQSTHEFKEKIKQKKFEGEIIYLNFQPCQEILQEISDLLTLKEKEKGITQINKKAIVKIFNPVDNKLILLLKDNNEKTSDIKINFRKTVAKNAEDAYNTSKKYQEKLKGAQEAIKKTEQQIKTLKQKDIIEEKKETKKEKKFWFEQFRWFISTDGNIIVAGKDAKSNETVVKKYLKERDRYAHADVHGAPSCVIKNIDINDKKIQITEKTLEEACIFAASYSKAWNQFSESQAYWVLPEQVSKTPQTGEFLPKGAFIIRGKRNYIRCKLEVAVGEIELDDTKKIMSGPIKTLQSKSKKYVILEPGTIKKNIISNKLAKAFNVTTETIQRVLPPGDINVVETEGFQLK